MSNENNEVAKVVDSGKITYANDVIAKIAALAAGEVEGIIGTSGGSIQEMLGMKNLTKGLKITLTNNTVAVDLHVIVVYGALIHKVCAEVQNSITKAIESMTDLSVSRVDVHVGSVKLPQEESTTKKE